MASASRLLDLPLEIRDQIYEYVALDAGTHIHSETAREVTGPTPLSITSRQIRQEYESTLRVLSPKLTAYARDFDFSHIISFLDKQSSRSEDEQPTQTRLQESRELDIVLSLSPVSPCPARKNLDKLQAWLERYTRQHQDDFTPVFETKYSVHPSSNQSQTGVAPVTLMQIIDDIGCIWFLPALPGPLKREVEKVRECLAAVEEDINRRRSSGRS